jgi:hypothetical protein
VNTTESFSTSVYADQMHMAERELGAFISAVAKLFGAEHARLAAEDWLDEAEEMDSPPRSTSRDWRTVTVAAAARLSSQLNSVRHCQTSLVATTDSKVLPTPSSNCFQSTLLV